jgi:hypothetical protein
MAAFNFSPWLAAAVVQLTVRLACDVTCPVHHILAASSSFNLKALDIRELHLSRASAESAPHGAPHEGGGGGAAFAC